MLSFFIFFYITKEQSYYVGDDAGDYKDIFSTIVHYDLLAGEGKRNNYYVRIEHEDTKTWKSSNYHFTAASDCLQTYG